MSVISIITATLNRPSLKDACESINKQSYQGWHHYVLGDGVSPTDHTHPNRTTLGFTRPLGAEEPTADMPLGTPNPIYRWALQHLALGEFVCFLDDDNTYLPGYLLLMRDALVRSAGAGIAICAIEDLRFDPGNLNHGGGQSFYRIDDATSSPPFDAYPECGRCDNSGFLTYSRMAKAVGFPKAAPEMDAVQDFQFISMIARDYGWVRVPEKLVRYGVGQNTPPSRRVLSS